MTRTVRVGIVVFLLTLCQTAASWACSVCYGGAESPVIRGAEMSILFMMVLTYLTIGGGVVGFLLLLRRRRKELARAQ